MYTCFLIGWSTRDCQISNLSEIDDEQSSRESTENGTISNGLELTVYETKFYQPGYFGLILVRIHNIVACISDHTNWTNFVQDLTYGLVDPLPHQFTFTLEVISYICLILSLVCLTFLTITYLTTK